MVDEPGPLGVGHVPEVDDRRVDVRVGGTERLLEVLGAAPRGIRAGEHEATGPALRMQATRRPHREQPVLVLERVPELQQERSIVGQPCRAHRSDRLVLVVEPLRDDRAHGRGLGYAKVLCVPRGRVRHPDHSGRLSERLVRRSAQLLERLRRRAVRRTHLGDEVEVAHHERRGDPGHPVELGPTVELHATQREVVPPRPIRGAVSVHVEGDVTEVGERVADRCGAGWADQDRERLVRPHCGHRPGELEDRTLRPAPVLVEHRRVDGDAQAAQRTRRPRTKNSHGT